MQLILVQNTTNHSTKGNSLNSIDKQILVEGRLPESGKSKLEKNTFSVELF